jgi:heptosyltransferase I
MFLHFVKQLRSGFEWFASLPLRQTPFPPVGCVNLFEAARQLWWHQFQYESYWTYWKMFRLLAHTPHPTVAETEPDEAIRAIVIYSPGHIGDVLMNVPLLRALRHTYQSADITWIVGDWSRAIAERFAYANRVDVFSPGWYQYQRGHHRGWARQQRRWIADRLKHPPADLFMSTAASTLDTYIIGRACRPQRWLGRKPAYSAFPVAVEGRVIEPDRALPEARDILRIAESLPLVDASSVLEYDVVESERREANRLLTSKGIAEGQRFVVIAPGAGWEGKQWLPERWGQVADQIRSAGVPVVLMGAPNEAQLAQQVKAAMHSQAIDLVGATSLSLMAAVIERAALWLGSDSGGMHIAAAVGTPTIALFGPTNPAKWAPEGEQHQAIRAVESCPGCIPWHPRARCQHGGRCMRAISVERVIALLPTWIVPTHSGADVDDAEGRPCGLGAVRGA